MSVLLAVAHGSKDPDSQAGVRELLASAERLRPGLRTADAYVDNASPSVRAALAELVAGGVHDVVLLPLLLTPACESGSLEPCATASSMLTGASPRRPRRRPRPPGW